MITPSPLMARYAIKDLSANKALLGAFSIKPFIARVLLSKKLPDHETKETMKYILGLIENEFFTEKEGLLLSKCYRLSKHWQGDLYFNILKAFEIGWVNNILKHFHVFKPQEKQRIGLRIMNKIKFFTGS